MEWSQDTERFYNLKRCQDIVNHQDMQRELAMETHQDMKRQNIIMPLHHYYTPNLECAWASYQVGIIISR